jgi:hypothetical protein
MAKLFLPSKRGERTALFKPLPPATQAPTRMLGPPSPGPSLTGKRKRDGKRERDKMGSFGLWFGDAT